MLTWIQGPSNKWKTFVGNRVAITQKYTSSSNWRHVLSQYNPANLISEWTELANLSSSALWWKGPQWQLQDNGTNFQGASNQWHEVYNMLQCFPQMERIQNFLASEGCEWKFIPQHGPHFRGLWEAAVISMKHHLMSFIRNTNCHLWRTTRGDPKITGIIFLKWSIRFYTITTLVSFKVLSF